MNQGSIQCFLLKFKFGCKTGDRGAAPMFYLGGGFGGGGCVWDVYETPWFAIKLMGSIDGNCRSELQGS